MPVSRIAIALSAGLIAAALQQPVAGAAEVSTRVCLSKAQQREAVASRRAIPLAQARTAVKGTGHRNIINARLCEGPGGLVYVLTLLPRSGKVSRLTIDATSGAILRGR